MPEEKRTSHKAVGGTHRAGKHVHTSHALPIGVDGLHLRQTRVVGQHLQFAPAVQLCLSALILYEHSVARGVSNSPMQLRHGTAVERSTGNGEIILREPFVSLVHCGKVVKEIAHKHRKTHHRSALWSHCIATVGASLAEQSVHHKTAFVHAFRHPAVISHGKDRAVLRHPFIPRPRRHTYLFHTGRIYVQVRRNGGAPVKCAPHYHLRGIVRYICNARTRTCRQCAHSGGTGEK